MLKIRKFAFILLLIATHAWADETVHLKANENTITTAISKTEITRISFLSEVESIHSIKGELEYEIVGRDIYLRAFADKPINFFLKTFSGKTYKLIATPENIPATQVFVKSQVIKPLKPKCPHKGNSESKESKK